MKKIISSLLFTATTVAIFTIAPSQVYGKTIEDQLINLTGFEIVNALALTNSQNENSEEDAKKILPQIEDLLNKEENNEIAMMQSTEKIEEAEKKTEEKPKPAIDLNDRSGIVNEAYNYLGVPYVWGGKTPSGFDCSGFTNYIYQQVYGIDIGSYTVPQESSGMTINIDQARSGDLLFWGSPGGTYHVGIYVGDNQYIHAPQSGEVIKVSPIDNYFTPDFAVHVAV